jgi:hypothetical protein
MGPIAMRPRVPLASAPTRTFAWTTPPCARTRAASVDHERSSSSAVPTELFGFPAGDAPPRSAEELTPGGAEAFRFGGMPGSLHAPRWARGSLGDAARARVEEKQISASHIAVVDANPAWRVSHQRNLFKETLRSTRTTRRAGTMASALDNAADPPREFVKHTRACFRCKLVKTFEQVRA